MESFIVRDGIREPLETTDTTDERCYPDLKRVTFPNGLTRWQCMFCGGFYDSPHSHKFQCQVRRRKIQELNRKLGLDLRRGYQKKPRISWVSMLALREVVAKFDKTTENFAVYKHQPANETDLICQVYIPRKQLNGNIPQELRVSIQQL